MNTLYIAVSIFEWERVRVSSGYSDSMGTQMNAMGKRLLCSYIVATGYTRVSFTAELGFLFYVEQTCIDAMTYFRFGPPHPYLRSTPTTSNLS